MELGSCISHKITTEKDVIPLNRFDKFVAVSPGIFPSVDRSIDNSITAAIDSISNIIQMSMLLSIAVSSALLPLIAASIISLMLLSISSNVPIVVSFA